MLRLGDGSKVEIPQILKETSIILSELLETNENEEEIPMPIIKTKRLFNIFTNLLIDITNKNLQSWLNRQCRLPFTYPRNLLDQVELGKVDFIQLYNIASFLSIECVEILIEHWFIYFGMKHMNRGIKSNKFKPEIINAGMLGKVTLATNNRKRLFEEITEGSDNKKQKLLNFILVKKNT